MFATSRLFLERLGLNALSDLPALADFVPEASIVEALERGLLVPSGADDVEVADDDGVEVSEDGAEVDESIRDER